MDTSWMHPDFLQAAGTVPAYQQILPAVKTKIQEETLCRAHCFPENWNSAKRFQFAGQRCGARSNCWKKRGLWCEKKERAVLWRLRSRGRRCRVYIVFAGTPEGWASSEIRVLSIRKSYPSPVLAKLLENSTGTSVVKIDRLFLLDQEPVFLEATCIPACYFPDCSAEVCSDTLWQLLFSGSEIQPMEAVETYDAALLSEKQAALLQCPAGSAAFQIQRVSRERHGAVFEVSRMVAPAGKNKLSLTFQPGGVRVSHPWIEPKTDG